MIRIDKIAIWVAFLFVIAACQNRKDTGNEAITDRPNILFAIADDASFPHMGAYGADWIDTPAFDLVAKNGILFMNAYTPNAKCAPSRAAILTGRNSWQLEEAANHWPHFPQKFKVYTEVLAGQGYFTGSTGKGWAPGIAKTKEGEPRHLAGQPYQKKTTDPPTSEISSTDYAANFQAFIDEKPDDKPFSFWYGALEPHRGYEWRSGIEKGEMSTNQINSVPGFFPDNDTVRTDMLDYGFEIEHFDDHLGRMLKILEERGELENTVVVVTSDNGMPFPRAKGQAYEFSNHLPLAIMWPAGINRPGRKVADFVSFIDFAPTFLELAGTTPTNTGMQSITGRSLVDIFESTKSGDVVPNRDHVLVGKERHDVGRPNDQGYPIRGIVTDDFLYVHNFKTERWPAGNPRTGYLNTDGSPTKTWILDHQNAPSYSMYWEQSFGKRPASELYDLQKDSANMMNLLNQQENSEAYRETAEQLRQRLFEELKRQGDPRMLGNGHVFDGYIYADSSNQNFYRRYMSRELDKSDAGWVNPSDFESKESEM